MQVHRVVQVGDDRRALQDLLAKFVAAEPDGGDSGAGGDAGSAGTVPSE
jgi:hypothetical protein